MLEFKDFSINDKELFDKYIFPYNFETSEYSFTSLFMWRRACEIQYALYKDALIIKRMGSDGTRSFMMPLGYRKEDLKDIIDTMQEYRKENNMEFLLKDVEESFLPVFREIYGDKYEIKEDRDDFDYVYERDKLASLSGNVLHKKKNHYNYFVRNYEHEDFKITKENSPEIIKAAKEWCCKMKCKGYLLYELRAIEELLQNLEKLNLIGMGVIVNGKVSAFTIGEIVNKDMAIVHVEKADADIRGAYNYVNKTFAEKYLTGVKWINREEDMGILGLRQAKMTYAPAKFAKKYMII